MSARRSKRSSAPSTEDDTTLVKRARKASGASTPVSCSKVSANSSSQASLPRAVICRRKPKHHFVTLPFEIRHQILKHLLLADQPIFFTTTKDRPVRRPLDKWDRQRPRKLWSDRKLWPEVLSTCKQLRDEGRPLLYNNTIGVQVGYTEPVILASDIDNRTDRMMEPIVLGRRYTAGGSPRSDIPAVLERLSRIDITFHAKSHSNGNDNRFDMRQAFRLLAREINEHSNWRNISIHLEGTDFTNPAPEPGQTAADLPTHLAPGEHLSTYVLQPLTCLRDRTTIQVTGTNTYINDKICMNLVTPGPCYMLEDMLGRLEAYCTPMISMETTKDEHSIYHSEAQWIEAIRQRMNRGVRPAVQAEDAKNFVVQRNILLRMIALLNAFRNSVVYTEDAPIVDLDLPLRWHGSAGVVGGFKPGCNSNLIDSERLLSLTMLELTSAFYS